MGGKQLQSLCSAGGDQDFTRSFLQQHLATFKSVPFVIDTQDQRFSWHGTPPIFRRTSIWRTCLGVVFRSSASMFRARSVPNSQRTAGAKLGSERNLGV